MNSLSDVKDFHDLDATSSSGTSHVPQQSFTVSSFWKNSRRDSGLLRDTRNDMEIPGNVFESPLAREGQPSEFFENTGNVMEKNTEVTQELVNSFSLVSSKRSRNPNDTSGIYCHNGTMHYPNFPTS